MKDQDLIQAIEQLVTDHNPPVSDLPGHVDFIKETNRSLVTKIKELFFKSVPVGSTKATIQVHAVMSFWYAQRNIERWSLIDKVFGEEDEGVVNHLKDLFMKAKYCINDFMIDLDEEKRMKLIQYVMDQYNGFTLESAKRYVDQLEK